MRRFVICFLILIVCLAMTGACFSEAGTEDESIGAMISGIVRGCYPECRLLDYAPIGQEKTEYIVLAADDADRTAVIIVSTGQPSAGVEFCNYGIMDGIQPDSREVQIMDHMSDGYPYVWYTDTDSSDLLYVVFHKEGDGVWRVSEAQFGDDWHELYLFRYNTEDQQIHVFLSGNELAAVPDHMIDRNAETFDPAAARQALRGILEPYL